MRIGFSLSPGGLLLPYHLGALASLAYHGHINESTPLAGSSAGAIAVASQASGVAPLTALEASIRVSGRTFNPLFVPSGRLLPSLRRELHQLLPPDAHEIVNDREGVVALAHRELFPQNKAVLQTNFETRKCLMDAVCDSSMFPYFLTNRPVRMVRRPKRLLPRAVVDGVFACDLQRVGCPTFEDCCAKGDDKKAAPDRTVMVSVFPTEILSMSTAPAEDQIGPVLEENMVEQAVRLVRMASMASTPSELKGVYQQGFLDAEHWSRSEERRHRKAETVRRREELRKLLG